MKIIKRIMLTCIAVCCASSLSAQLTVENDGRIIMADSATTNLPAVTIGKNNTLGYTNVGLQSVLTRYNSISNIAILGEANPALSGHFGCVGVAGIARGGLNGNNYGIAGILKREFSGSAVYGIVGNGSTSDFYTFSQSYAGYFKGNTMINGPFNVIGETSINGDIVITGNVSLNGAYSSLADTRYQENILSLRDFPSQTEALSNIRTYQFTWNRDAINTSFTKDSGISNDEDAESTAPVVNIDNKKHFGIDAKELRTLFPGLVNEDEKGNLSVNYQELIPIMIQSIQELNNRIKELEKR